MLESFYIRQHPEMVDTQWRKKILLSSEILGQEALRQMRPELLGDRSRLDLMWYQNKLGLRGPSNEERNFPFFEIPEGPDTAHPDINAMLEQFKNSTAPRFFEMAQIRFRSHGKENKGIWIDCANITIKALLDEKTWLTHLIKNLGWRVEVGQKQKEVQLSADALKLEAASPENWLSSFDQNNNEIPLKSFISSFSQPGPEANRALMAAGLELLDACSSEPHSFCEWGAGYGNLTACFSSRFKDHNWASEIESAGVMCLKDNQKFFPNTLFEQQNAGQGRFPVKDLWLLDPPRSGFGELLKLLPQQAKPPQNILIYHCHNRGLLSDSKILKEAHYKLVEWSSVDIFPATPYHEVLSLWKIL